MVNLPEQPPGETFDILLDTSAIRKQFKSFSITNHLIFTVTGDKNKKIYLPELVLLECWQNEDDQIEIKSFEKSFLEKMHSYAKDVVVLQSEFADLNKIKQRYLNSKKPFKSGINKISEKEIFFQNNIGEKIDRKSIENIVVQRIDQKGSPIRGLKDAVIWESFIGYIKKNNYVTRQSQLVFLTGNTKDFCSKNNKNILHEDFSKDRDYPSNIEVHVASSQEYAIWLLDSLPEVDSLEELPNLNLLRQDESELHKVFVSTVKGELFSEPYFSDDQPSLIEEWLSHWFNGIDILNGDFTANYIEVVDFESLFPPKALNRSETFQRIKISFEVVMDVEIDNAMASGEIFDIEGKEWLVADFDNGFATIDNCCISVEAEFLIRHISGRESFNFDIELSKIISHNIKQG